MTVIYVSGLSVNSLEMRKAAPLTLFPPCRKRASALYDVTKGADAFAGFDRFPTSGGEAEGPAKLRF